MTKKTRYLLLAALFVVFFIVAPLILLYLGGISYDFQKKAFVKTGILAVRVEPKNAAIYLNGKKQPSSSGDLKFLLPGEYDISLQLKGYRTWSKQLGVSGNQVTWASPVPNKIFLFAADNKPQNLSDGVLDFAQSGDRLVYLTPGLVTITSLTNPGAGKKIILPETAGAITASPSGSSFLLQSKTASSTAEFLLDAGSGQLTNLSPLFSGSSDLRFSDSGGLWDLENNILYQVSLQPLKKTPVVWNVSDFTVQSDRIYFLRQGSGSGQLLFSPLSGGSEQVLASSTPNFAQSRILITPQKQIFLRLDSTLYTVNSSLTKIADNLSGLSFEPDGPMLAAVSGGEVDYFNFQNQAMQLVTRSGNPIAEPLIRDSVNTAFIDRGNSLVGMELDLRDRQNEYTFYNGTDIKKIAVNGDATAAAVLDGSTLKTLKLR